MFEAIMQVILIYILFVIITTVLFLLIKKKCKYKIIAILYYLIIVSPFFLYLPVEINTYLYGKEFENIKIETGFNNTAIYYKVFSIKDKQAKLFFVEGENRDHDVGIFYYFKKENEELKLYSWETVWTNLGGSVSELLYLRIFKFC